MSLRELRIRFHKDLSKYRIPVDFKIIPSGESAVVGLNPWRIQFFQEVVESRYNQCLYTVLTKHKAILREAVYARNTELLHVSTSEVSEFYNKFHIQGFGQGTVFALVYKGRVLSMMSVRLGASNTSNKGSYELNRYASDPEYFVIGGFEKLMSCFEREYSITRWVSYADLMVSSGSLYKHNGWSLVSQVKPDYRYLYKGVLTHKFNFRIARFRSDSTLLYKEGLTEKQLADLNKIPRVYDAGKLKFEKIVGKKG